MIPNNFASLLLDSWNVYDSKISSFHNIFEWVNNQNKTIKTQVIPVSLEECEKWSLSDDGIIKNDDNAFFSICGIKSTVDDKTIEQPIILQDEIGYLGIICSVIDGVLYFLMQAKIEPGNINCVQISPTLQATESNYTQKHGGKVPQYYDLFTNVKSCDIVSDQIEAEQSSRFLGKRNRNIIIFVEDGSNIKISPSHLWMTLGQIKKMMTYPNLVNMDTRTVISILPFYTFAKDSLSRYHLFQNECECLPNYSIEKNVFSKLSGIRMLGNKTTKTTTLFELNDWSIEKNRIVCKHNYPFEVIFCKISIENREVKTWCQPLIKAKGKALFSLGYRKNNGYMEFLVKIKKEIGSRDIAELGPTIQKESIEDFDSFELKLQNEMEENKVFDNLLSEEGGRFYHEQNRNVIFEIKENIDLPEDYFWIDFITLNHLICIGGMVNIQLRNLLSLLELNYE